jgi:hypothetical protein
MRKKKKKKKISKFSNPNIVEDLFFFSFENDNKTKQTKPPLSPPFKNPQNFIKSHENVGLIIICMKIFKNG